VPKTRQHYIGALQEFTAFLGRLLDRADAEDIRRYQVHLRDRGTSNSSINAAPRCRACASSLSPRSISRVRWPG